MALTPKQRQKAIDTIVANCDCWKREGDKEILNGLSDEKIEDLIEEVEEHVNNRKIAQFVTNEEGAFTDPDTGMTYRIDPDTMDVQRAPTTNMDGEHCGEDEEYDEETEECHPKKKNGMTGNRRNKDKPMTEEEFWRMAPPSLRKQHARMVANEKRLRADLIDTIVTNASNDEDEQEELREIHSEMPTEHLEKLARNARRKSPAYSEEDEAVGDYSGLGMFPVHNRDRGNGESEDHLIPPTINYEELSQTWPNGGKKKVL